MFKSTRFTPSYRSSDMLRDVQRDINQVIKDVRWLMLEERLERFRQEFRAELQATLRLIDAKVGANGAADDPACSHSWPDELTSDARCDLCGIRYDEFSRPGSDPTLDEAVSNLREAGLLADGTDEHGQ